MTMSYNEEKKARSLSAREKDVVLKVVKSDKPDQKIEPLNVVDQECLDLLALIKTNTKIEPLNEASWYLEKTDESASETEIESCPTREAEKNSPMGTLDSWREWLTDLRAPLAVLAAIGFVPKLIIAWSTMTIAKPVTLWLLAKCSSKWQKKFKEFIPDSIKNSEFRQELSEGLDQSLPFMLFWLYLFCIPFAAIWIISDWIKSFFADDYKSDSVNESALSFRQNRNSHSSNQENNFYYSKIYGVVVIAFFALGIPALVSYSIYVNLGIENSVEASMTLPVEKNSSLAAAPIWKERKSTSLASRKAGASKDFPQDTVVMGYDGNYLSFADLSNSKSRWFVFFVLFYLPSLGVALTAVFIRAWFLFPINFLSNEHDVILTEYGIRRKGIRDWFLNVITLNKFAIGGGPDSLKWSNVKSLRRLEEGFTKLYPLPDTAFGKDTYTYKLLNKVAQFYDGITNKVNSARELVFSSTEKGADGGKNIKIDLNNLGEKDRARLYYSVRKWAPHVIIPEDIEIELLGSTVFQDVKYTQLWFDLLVEEEKEAKEGHLNQNDQLKLGEYVIEKRLNSGGQATAYLARKTDGSHCVLKEFILAQSQTAGALIESAREFEGEVNLLSQLDHPGIVKIEDYFTEHKRVYAALEYIEGETLRQRVSREGALSEAEVIEIGRQVLTILEYLHERLPPIVHRDVTPENLMITKGRRVKLIDFSLASNDKELTNSCCGKQGYTPPEQFREEACPQSDLYALGATLHFLLTGNNPKPVTISSPKSLTPSISDELNAIVERATALDLETRYESAHWFKLDLENLI